MSQDLMWREILKSFWILGELDKPKAISNGTPIWKPKLKMGLQHNTYGLQQSTHTEDPLWVLGEA